MWKPLGNTPTDALVDARLQLHWASQLLAAFGQDFVRSRDDDSHRSLSWDDMHGILRSEESESGLRLVLWPRSLQVALFLRGVPTGLKQSLTGMTFDAAFDWVERAVGVALEMRGPAAIDRPEFEPPQHPVSSGTPFGADPEALAEVEAWISNASNLLWRFAMKRSEASPVRCWPHHFDTATLVTVAEDESGARTVGIGMSPGDADYPEPYWYVGPYPHPDPADLPELDAGRWHTEGWVGAVLTRPEVVVDRDPDAQIKRVVSFVDQAFKASVRLVRP